MNLIPKSGFLADYVKLYTPLSEAPAEAHLATALAVASAAIGWRAQIRWGESAEPCTLFIMLQGASATAKKTTTAKTGASLVRHAEKLLAEEHLERSPLTVRSVSHTSRRGLMELVATSDQELAKSWETAYPPGLLLDWDEFGMILGNPGDLKGGDYVGQIRTALMELYGGRHGGVQIGALKMPPSRCAVAILATMTRQELEQRVSSGLLRDGFMGRFVMMPHPGRERYMATPPPWLPEHSNIRDRLAAFLAKVSTSKHEMGDVFRRLTPAAREMRESWYDRRMKQLDEDAKIGGEVEAALADAMGRLQTTAMKVAAVSAVCEMAEDEDISEVLIDTRHIEYGVALAEHALTEIKALSGEGGPPVDRYRIKVVRYLKNVNGHGPVKRSELLDKVKFDGITREDRWKVIQSLHKEAIVEISLTRTGGRPAQMVELVRE
ncbi:MAG TPA: DUF3987 domain-containing protein [Gemmatimonadota bacterium]|nr:DUF3987 domain-containing protein [Gemmatimonadota bacterium]